MASSTPREELNKVGVEDELPRIPSGTASVVNWRSRLPAGRKQRTCLYGGKLHSGGGGGGVTVNLVNPYIWRKPSHLFPHHILEPIVRSVSAQRRN